MRKQFRSAMLLVHPNSYAAKEEIKALGGRWDPESKGWGMPSQEALDRAFAACESTPKERPEARFWGEEDDSYDWLTAPAIYDPIVSPLPGQGPDAVKTGIVFTGIGRSRALKGEEWVVLCTYEAESTPDLADVGDYLCGCLNNRQWRYLSPEKIAELQWTGETLSMEKAKDLYDRFLDR